MIVASILHITSTPLQEDFSDYRTCNFIDMNDTDYFHHSNDWSSLSKAYLFANSLLQCFPTHMIVGVIIRMFVHIVYCVYYSFPVMDDIPLHAQESEEIEIDPAREAYYKEDPKKALRKFFDREGA